jgi:hypothetical protein
MFENLISGIAVLLGGTLIVAGIRALYLGRQVHSWLPTPAVILSSKVVPATEGQHQPFVSYRYSFNGAAFEATRIRFIQLTSSFRGPAEAVIARCRPTQQVIAFVNPSRPSEALLEREVQLVPALIFLVGGLGLLLFGLYRLLSHFGSAA